MLEYQGQLFFTIDELTEKTGYRKNTLYNFTLEKIISPPIKGLPGTAYSSQGLYRSSVIEELEKYQELKIAGMKKRDIIKFLNNERVNNESRLPLLETRG